MSKKLVAYFSASGITESVARNLSQTAGADLYRIQPEVPYTSADLDWMNKKSRSSIEMNDPVSRPAIAAEDLDISSYDVVFLGFPVWWYFSGKTVIPFATSGSSGIENCEKKLQQQYPSINWKSGKLLNGHPGQDVLDSWVKSLNV